jgi:hypothetical protein
MCSQWNNWLIALSGVLVLLWASGEEAFAQQRMAEAERGAARTLSPQAIDQEVLDSTSKNQATNYELAALLKRLEESPGDLGRDGSGNVVSVALRWTNANDRALVLVSSLDSLQELRIQGPGRPETGEWTREGISCLGRLTNLVTLRVACIATKPALKDGVFEEICNLRGLRTLSLVAAYPQRSEYVALTNLQNLAELRVSYATNFGDAELCLLTNLANLRSLLIHFDAVSREGTNVLSRVQRLTNTTVKIRRPLP